jgi:hypothetical protein
MPNPESVIVYALPPQRAQLNGRFGSAVPDGNDSNAFNVTFPDGSTARLPEHNLFFAARRLAYFAAPLAQLAPLEACTAVQLGPHGRELVATADIPAGTLLQTAVLNVCMTPAEVAQVETQFEAFVLANLWSLMEKSPDDEKEYFEVVATPARVFIGAVAQLTTHPIIAELMRYDCFTDDCLTLELRRSNANDRVWLVFWIHRLAPCPPTRVYHLFHFVRNFAWPSPDGLALTFGVPLCCANAPDAVWAQYERVMDGLQDASVDVLADQYLSTFMMDLHKGEHMKVYIMHHVPKGAPLVLDYGRGYAASRADTVLHILGMSRNERVHYFHLYDNIARSVSQDVREHFLDYIERSLKRARRAKPAPAPPKAPEPPTTYTCATTGLRLCDNPACRERLPRPLLCARCGGAAYCSKPCQTAAWKDHKPQCVAK